MSKGHIVVWTLIAIAGFFLFLGFGEQLVNGIASEVIAG